MILLSCTTYKRDRFAYHQDEEQSWINSYKYEAFYTCINEGLKNDSLKIILSKEDLFTPYDGINFSPIDQARQLGQAVARKIPKPFIKIEKGEEKLAGKRYISFSCLNYFASRELDSIAKKQYEISKKRR